MLRVCVRAYARANMAAVAAAAAGRRGLGCSAASAAASRLQCGQLAVELGMLVALRFV